MRKIIILTISAIFSNFFGVLAQFANVSYEARVNSMFSSEGGIGGPCWETGNEEYTGNMRLDENGGTVGTNHCGTCDNNSGGCTYGANASWRSETNRSVNFFSIVYDFYEDDGGSRCSFNSGDDCRWNGTQNVDFRVNAIPTAAGTWTNATNSNSSHNYSIGYSWRYAGTTNLITPTCTPQNAAYSAGAISSWSVNMVAGVTYNFNNCSSASSDTYLRIYGPDGYTIVATGDDNCGSLSSINYTAASTGTYYIELSQFSRGALANAGTLTYSIVPKTGANISNAIAVGTLGCGLYSNTQNNTANTGFCNDIGNSSDDIYYSFTLATSGTVNISHCGSGFDTYINLLNSGGTVIAVNDDNGPLCGGTAASMQVGLAAGTYYVVSEGFGANSGNITTQIQIQATNNVGVITAPASICVGSPATISNVTAATGASAFSTPVYYYYYQRTSAPVTGWIMYDGPTTNPSSNLPAAVTGTAGTYLLARNSEFTCTGQASAPFLNLTVDAPSTLGTLSNAGPINFCDAGGNFGAALTVAGQTGTIVWDWGSNNGVWNNNWLSGNASGICCFPKKVSNSDANADRIRYRVTNGACPSVTSATVLIQNRYNEAPSSLAITGSPACPSVGNITLTATFPSSINMNGTVEFFSGSCGGTLVGSVTANPNSATAAVTIPTPAASTTYFVRYNPGTGSGCSATACATASFTANTLSVAPTSITGTSTICAGSSTTLTVSGGSLGTGGVWRWYSGSCGGTLVGSGTSINVSPGTNTTYFVRAEGTCNTTTCASQAVTVNTLSTAPTSITGTSTICAGGSTTLTASGGSLGTGGVWRWYSGSCGGTLVGSGTSINVSPGTNTTYFVRAEGTCNTTTCASQAVTVNTLSTAPTSITGTSTICAGSSTTLTVSGGSLGTGGVWRWYSGSCGGTLVGSGTSINVSPGTNTTYFVRAEGTCNTTTCASQAVTVNTLSTAPTSITGTSAICAGGSTTLTVSGGSLGTGGVWRWYSGSCGGTLVGSGTSINVSPATNTTYFVRAEGTCNNTTCASQAITVNPFPSAFSANILTSTPLCYGSNARIEVPVSQSGTTYQLRESTTNVGVAQAGTGGSLIFTSNNLTATNGNYNVIATTGPGCTTVVNVSSIGVDAIPAALGGNGDVRTCYVNGNNAFVEFRSASGSLIAINPGTENLGNVTVTEYVGSPLNSQACGTTQPWYVTSVLGRHWVITPENQPTGPVTVRLYYDNSEYAALAAVANANANPNDDVAAQGSLDLSKYSNPGNPSAVNGVFTDNCAAGGTTTAHVPTGTGSMNALLGYGSFPASGLYNSYSISSFSEFWMSGTNNVSPLPIVLQSFTASCDKGMVRLDWVTATEINNERFTIHRSADLMEWEEVLSQVGAGNSNTPLAYTGVDERPLNGLSYYRLTQRDYDGTTESFEPISVTCYTDGSGNSMLVFPNPADDRFTVSVTVTEAISNAGIEIMDMNGKRVMLRNVNLVKGTNEFTFDRSLMNPGTYFIKLGSGKLVLSPIKLIIK